MREINYGYDGIWKEIWKEMRVKEKAGIISKHTGIS